MNITTSVVCMGAHILDVLVRPVTDIPAGQDTALVEQMRTTAAGTAAGTALTFAKLGASVRTSGAIGTDPPGDLLLSLLDRAGIDTGLVVRKPDVPTSMSVLPIRPNGERPALHLLGANPAYTLDDVDWDAIAPAMAYTDYLLPNEDQVLGFTGAADLAEGCSRLLEAGAGLLAITCGAEG